MIYIVYCFYLTTYLTTYLTDFVLLFSTRFLYVIDYQNTVIGYLTNYLTDFNIFHPIIESFLILTLKISIFSSLKPLVNIRTKR